MQAEFNRNPLPSLDDIFKTIAFDMASSGTPVCSHAEPDYYLGASIVLWLVKMGADLGELEAQIAARAAKAVDTIRAHRAMQ